MQYYGERFRSYRKIIYQMMGSKTAITQFHTLMQIESRRFLSRCIESPEELREHVRTCVSLFLFFVRFMDGRGC